MGHKITEVLITIAENLERLAKLKQVEDKEYRVKQIHTTEAKYIEQVQFVNPDSETGSYVTPKGTLAFYIKLK